MYIKVISILNIRNNKIKLLTEIENGRYQSTVSIFGALDPGSLDKALSILEEVREGRCVGVISHVSEMQSRIPSRLEVIKPPQVPPSHTIQTKIIYLLRQVKTWYCKLDSK